jgi:ATP-dependent Clp protease adapter protein ClpS
MKNYSGTLRVATIGGVPVFVHWSALIVGILAATSARFRPLETLYCLAAFAVLIAAHELGHVLAARVYGLKVYAVEVSGAGGTCHLQAPSAIGDTLFVASAGLLAQALIFACTIAYTVLVGPPSTAVGKCFVKVFTVYNAMLFILNIIPISFADELGTDGLVLWKLLRYKVAGEPHPFYVASARPRMFAPDTELLSIRELVPDGFIAGVELLNDSVTPMGFVVGALEKHMNIDRESAVQKALRIHWEGGGLLSTDTFAAAEQMAKAISAEAASLGHPLICRAVKVSARSDGAA